MAAIGISFIGSLPLGTVNVAAFQITVSDGYSAGLWFAAGSLFAETLYVVLALTILDKIMKHKWFLRIMHWVSLIIILGLAVMSLSAALRNEDETSNLILSGSLPPFLLGFVMMGINPVQIPFWAGWTTVLVEKKVMKKMAAHYVIFTIGAAIGSFCGSLLFIFTGKWLTEEGKVSLHMIHWIVGSLFLISAVLQLIRILKMKKK